MWRSISTYLVPAGSPIRAISEVDRPGVRIAVAAGTAYDLWLTRNIRQAELVRVKGIGAAFEHFVREGLEVVAGLKQQLLGEVGKLPGARILEGRFAAVQQAIGTLRENGAGAAFLADVCGGGEGVRVGGGVDCQAWGAGAFGGGVKGALI